MLTLPNILTLSRIFAIPLLAYFHGGRAGKWATCSPSGFIA